MWNVECGMWNVECGMWNVECGMWIEEESAQAGAGRCFHLPTLDIRHSPFDISLSTAAISKLAINP
jgi:hypothetical protein